VADDHVARELDPRRFVEHGLPTSSTHLEDEDTSHCRCMSKFGRSKE
jgi:hypothetical protein